MFYYYDDAGDGGFAGENSEVALMCINKNAKQYLVEKHDGIYTVCLINFDTKVSTIYEFTAEFSVSSTQY